jgi:hypothetical protein
MVLLHTEGDGTLGEGEAREGRRLYTGAAFVSVIFWLGMTKKEKEPNG